MRVYPHQQDTGGFFIAVLEKKSETPWENDKRCSSNRRLLPWETEADWQVSYFNQLQLNDATLRGATLDSVMLCFHECFSDFTFRFSPFA